MAGNSQRRGAIKKTGKGNPTAGSGGRRRKGLEGKGPTPRASERPNHKSYKMANAAAKRDQARPKRKPGTGTEYVAGRNPVVELLREGVPVSALYLADGLERDERLAEILKIAATMHLNILEVTRNELDKLTLGATHQGVAARLDAYGYASIDDVLNAAAERGEDPLIVMLDGITDPRNLGAIIRSASGFGAHGVIIPERRAASITAAAWKTSAGAAARLAVARVTNLTRTLNELKDAGLMVVGLAADGTVDIAQSTLVDGPLVVVVGSEGKGLSRLVGETCDEIVSIPMANGLESLNAGVAAGVALYAVQSIRN